MDTETINFQLYWWPILLLLPLPLILAWIFKRRNEMLSPALKVPFFNSVHKTLDSRTDPRPSTYKTKTLIFWIVWILCLFAAARPQWIGDKQTLPLSGRDLMLAVDISGSMAEQDMLVNGQFDTRLSVVKNILSNFIHKRTGDRLGLILFGSKAYLQSPLTYDTSVVAQFLQEAVIGLAGKKTAIGDAIGLALKRLEDSDHSQKVLILLTDGRNTAGTIHPSKAAQLAAQSDMTIYTVGIGSDRNHKQSFLGAFTLNPAQELDEKTLKSIAKTTGGQYYRAKDINELATIYATLDALEPIENDSSIVRPTKELYFWPLLVSIVVIFTMIVARLVSTIFAALFNQRKQQSV